jgi:hypothetical protein
MVSAEVVAALAVPAVALAAESEGVAQVVAVAPVVVGLVVQAADPVAVVRAVAVGGAATESVMPQYGVSSWRSPRWFQ